MRSAVEWAERHQVPLYLGALALGAAIGLLVPSVAEPAESLITPVLALLLYATFLGVPFREIGAALRDRRFLTTVLVVNFAVVPVVVFVLSRVVAHDQAVLAGVLFVLLTPCVDYVIVFTGIAGGAKGRLLAATPLLMLAQLVLLPAYLWVMAGPELVATFDVAPFVEAFLLLIVLPLAAAGLTQLLARTPAGRVVQGVGLGAMVPLMMLTLAVVVVSQIAHVASQLGAVLLAALVFVVFAAVMVPIGIAAGRVARMDVPARRAVVFSGATRNSLVVLPLVLALPPALDLAPLVVVTQTLVELVAMVVFVRLVPRLVPDGSPMGRRRASTIDT
ncbi:arsenic resistance protein [Agromyces aerolatus]|uniref:arsenic resistance protein n=1 Tax=Agromyces sp. LY-1074 TaxID=3074080 RepID=UPI002861A437|nr:MULTISPECIES: bile acid:sodium symporter [unclassified Agromyces]MDR5698958.1 bile acid:sodium symporter [Agromyces sp. LY-1074]MDR5705264.1 bile acid:sodium symporter [Agromyces sp. LY-1358]